MNIHRSPIALVVVALCFCRAALRAETVLLAPLRDASLIQHPDGALANGAGSHFFVGHTHQFSGFLRRGLIAFEVAGEMPPGATVESVTLRLNLSRTIFGPVDVALHRVSASWGEGGSDATADEGRGIAAAPGDTTWKHRFFPDELWDSEGGDFAAEASASASAGGLGAVAWEGPGMVADVQRWLDAPQQNFGWILIGGEGIAGSAKRFDSHENLAVERRPVLEVTFTPPSGGAVRFIRGDCNGDAETGGVSDAIALLSFNFLGGVAIGCLAACDTNGDGQTVGVSDAIALLSHNFIGGSEIQPPFPACGEAALASDAVLGCQTPPEACR